MCDARPPRDDALQGQRLGAPIGWQDARLAPLVARIGYHWRSRRRSRSAAAGFGLQPRLVCVCPPHAPVLPSLPNLATPPGVSQSPARASLPSVTFSLPSCLRLLAGRLPFLSAVSSATTTTRAAIAGMAALASPALLSATRAATPTATNAIPTAPLASTAPQSRHSWPPTCRGRAARPAHARAPCRLARTTGFRATTRHHTATNGACCARRHGDARLQF